ncbi:unnamed protein product [Rotaria sp. Silwood2]|nr:unnamed protein product [Rotaria sp. Silwood2]CAF2957835.1 unnamed protein product [Rotaria sp. Silwood2]CAF3027118.1 unnamed protein product [Rotaria sp. Silwood2]CAF3317136.1 unnamed protein product [Rotaria sp. Silwood2]CAF4065115.1 unnamed protein product [Rotaria sp. Silwood2]
MWTLNIALISFFLTVTNPQFPSDNARRKLVSLIAEVRQADGRRYASRDHLGNPMNCIKIIKRTGSDDFIGVYHTYVNNVPRVHLAVSNDLLQWTWLQELAVHASQPTIAASSDHPEGYILVWEETPSSHLKFAFYMTWDDLKVGTAQQTHETTRTLSHCAEGTPNIYGEPTLASIDVGFHFSDDCTLDRQARASLTNFSLWTQIRKQPNVDNALLHYGVRGNIRDRDALSNFDGYAFTIIEGQYQPKNIGTWRIFVFDSQTENADQVPIVTNGRSQAFTNPTMTITTINGQRILLVTLFIVNEKSAPREAGQLIYYRKF